MHTKIRKTMTALALVVALAATIVASPTMAQTPAPSGCDAGIPAATPGMNHGMAHGATTDSTPHAGMRQVEFDLAYIDMMIPHHESIIALAEVALPELSDPRLIEMAENIIATQSAEIEEMRHLRDMWYPDAPTVSMEAMLGMPGMGTDMSMMHQQMSADWQVQSFCAAENKDLAFIEQTIPHHQMAIDVSEAALTHAVHPELTTIAEDVIDAQQAEIDELEMIRAELTGDATPAT
jgi:uncharacterized protein (DUF305 family)